MLHLSLFGKTEFEIEQIKNREQILEQVKSRYWRDKVCPQCQRLCLRKRETEKSKW